MLILSTCFINVLGGNLFVNLPLFPCFFNVAKVGECDKYITHIPNVSYLRHLGKLSFRECKNLSTIHYSAELLEKLKILEASESHKLKSLPPLQLTSVEQLKLWNCVSLESFL